MAWEMDWDYQPSRPRQRERRRMSDRNLPPGFGVGPANAWGQMMDESLRIRDEAKDEQRERRRMSERNEAGLWLDRLEALDAEVGGEITALTHRLAEAERQRDALEEQLKESLADRVAGAAAHQLCSQARNDLRAKLAEAERPRNDIQTCGHPRSAIAGGPTTWWCRMCDGRMADE